MFTPIIKLLIGDISEKRIYKQEREKIKKRIKALDPDYIFTFKKITHYLLINGISLDSDPHLFMNLIDFFETGCAQGKGVIEIIGTDISGFVNELINESATQYAADMQTKKTALNQRILGELKKED